MKWSYDTGSAASGGLQSGATLTPDGRVLVGDSAANVHCLDAAKGSAALEAQHRAPAPGPHLGLADGGERPRARAGRLRRRRPVHQGPRRGPRPRQRGAALDGAHGAGPDLRGRHDRGLHHRQRLPRRPLRRDVRGRPRRGLRRRPRVRRRRALRGRHRRRRHRHARPRTRRARRVFMASVGCYSGPRVGNADRIFRVRARTASSSGRCRTSRRSPSATSPSSTTTAS